MGKAKKSDILEALEELSEKKEKKSKKKENELALVPVVDDLKYNGFEKGQVIEIPLYLLDGTAENFHIESIGIENGRYYAMLNRITTTGNIDKRYKPIKKFFEDNFIKVNTFNKGDKIFLSKRGIMGWEANDYTRQLKKNVFYTVRSMRFDKTLIYLELDETGTLLHPNHFTKKEY